MSPASRWEMTTWLMLLYQQIYLTVIRTFHQQSKDSQIDKSENLYDLWLRKFSSPVQLSVHTKLQYIRNITLKLFMLLPERAALHSKKLFIINWYTVGICKLICIVITIISLNCMAIVGCRNRSYIAIIRACYKYRHITYTGMYMIQQNYIRVRWIALRRTSTHL